MTDSTATIALQDTGPGVRTAHFEDASWLLEVRILDLSAAQPLEQRAPDGEAFLLVLSGTHDLYAGGGNWVRRGTRPEPFTGRPVGVFLPPATPFKLENGTGRALLLAARQPEEAPLETPKEALSKKPLLPMAGSGKAFDPATGSWKPQEAFLSSPEAILPRRIARIDADGATAHRVLDMDYKSLGLCIDEVGLADGESATLPPHATAQDPCEIALYYETDDGALAIGDDLEVTGHGVVRVSTASVPRLTAKGGRAYAAVLYAGPKPAQ